MAFTLPEIRHFNWEDLDHEEGTCNDCGEERELLFLSEECGECEECFVPGHYARLSAPGYLDCTDWHGPHETEEDALKELCEFYECDEDGNDLPEAG